MSKIQRVALALMVALSGAAVQAEDLSGSTRFLCASAQAMVCVEDGECAIGVPWKFNIPEFVEVDLEEKRVATTESSGENRATEIGDLLRKDGVIVFHGIELGRAFSWVIRETTGRTSVAIAGDGVAIAVFGTCTPVPTGSGN